MEEFKGDSNHIGLRYGNLDNTELFGNLQKINIQNNWEEKYESQDGDVLVSPSLSGQNILEILSYNIDENGDYPDFKNKEITDIGSGLGGFIFELENSAKKINAVDPLYSNEKREEILDREIDRAKQRGLRQTDIGTKKIKQIKKEIDEKNWLLKRQPGNYNLYDEISFLEQEIEKIEKNLLNNKILNDIEKRKEKGFQNSEKITLVGESGEDTKLPNDSQDYVFMTNVITKECVNPYKLLTEASRILKPGGKIIIVDEHQEVERLFKKIGKNFKIIGKDIRVLELEKEEHDIGEDS